MSSRLPLVKTLIFTLLVPGTVTVLVPYWLLRHPHFALACASPRNLFSYLGVVGIALGAAVSLWCAWDFAVKGGGTPAPIDPPKELLVNGLYRYVRNPMYVGVLIVLLGEAFLFCSVDLLFYSFIMLAVFHLFVVLYEEPTLAKKFGESYRRYLLEVPRWWPRFGKQGQ
jgi:protein-S-isoprenylcysteine O-methyltransferase Ste14